MEKLIDSHSHKNIESTEQIFIVTDLNSFAPQLIGGFFTLGIHPWFIDDFKIDQLDRLLEKYCNHQRFVGLGEIGLDKARGNFSNQLDLFKSQLQLVQKYKISRIILHNVKSQGEIMHELAQIDFKGTVQWHGFNGNKEQIEQILNAKYQSYFGLGKLVTKNTKINQYFTSIPLEQILLETDDDNEIGLIQIYEYVSERFNIKINEFIKKIYINNINFLNISDWP